MKISSKGRYGLASMISLSTSYENNEYITIISIAEKLGISKIYLEQVFSLLKRANLVTSTKGSQGGYQLSKSPDNITAFDILSAIEIGLFEKTDTSVSKNSIHIEKSMSLLIWDKLDNTVYTTLNAITLNDLVKEANKYTNVSDIMFYI
ncbi:RrF2 family transcriptional regulator [Clostridium gasigenes]|uniref:Rrf2 family protein n=1 Tax=Clostridium gasigenes TaxID=94869 RepID=A0A1H0LKP8_9CLOT|nr:Rrf2 family transcriptional regulator [Clostridium gasigenes]MBB6622466.1 Rrf2 family transcriptional regulator [Clostridium gasigenes]MBB6713966.1 Rrf2 family transcriptional regulator [Clostridium gasigenes]MBU3087237.1 Rrf2 family transcriptional regulator [Clostridium gasigenes]MBU3103518.1 Rrf2 family transcriptional regulator [Clostridium gasigenes]MBU3130955.1 Rrf2 family transcriptional regulator [Clostridium gasigenes]